MNIDTEADANTNTAATNPTTVTGTHICYLLVANKGECTYNGYTNNLQKRLRQHNGEISGGARSTNKEGKRPWKCFLYITSDDPTFDKKRALSLEYYIRYPSGRTRRPVEFRGPLGRIKALPLSLQHDKFRDTLFTAHVSPDYLDHVREALANTANCSIEVMRNDL